MTKVRKAAVNFIFITVLLDIIGFGIIIPVLPGLLEEMKGINANEAAVYGGYLLFAFAITQFLFSPFMGNLSDQYGRRPIILLSLFGFVIDYLLLAVAPTFVWLVIGRLVAGFFGASYSTANSYIADISTDENRSKNFGMMGAAFGVGFIIGPLLGGLLGEIGLRVPFYVAAGLTFINLLYGYFILPESLALENRRKFEWKKANPISTLKKIGTYKSIGYLLLAFFIINLGSHAVQSNWTYFTMYKFDWSEGMVGASLAVVGVLVGVVQAVVAQKAADTIGVGRSIIVGFGLYTIGMFLFSIASTTWMMFLFLIPYALGGVAMPNLQAFMVSKVSPKEQGELQGGLTSLISLSTIIGPLMMTQIFFYFTSEKASFQFAGAPFLLGGILMLISFLIVFFVLREKDVN
ncbi:MAG: DHA1 family tetracycline resistance protein-like MFS transporter [Saprospiraceae bacterium]|jgi:DHA1 family tetracycline resistance protein-like MFS transporter